MKKTLLVFVALAMMITLFGCANSGKNAAPKQNDGEISVISREEGSGTRGAFIELMGIEQKDQSGTKIDHTTVDAEITNSTSVMMMSVAGNVNAIGYISLGSLNDTVRALHVDGAAPTAENIASGTYKVARPFNIVTKGEGSEATKAFISFIMSAEGQRVVLDNGYIPVEGAPAFAGSTVTGKVVVAGSSSVTPVMEKLKEAYIVLNPNAEIELQMSDSTTGITSTIEGVCDIGMASRNVKDTELEAGLVNTVIATDGIAIIVNKDNAFEGLTSEQIRSIYTGEITTWGELE